MEAQLSQTQPRIISDSGAGRAFVTLYDDLCYAQLSQAVADRLQERARSILVESPPITSDNWKDCSDRVRELLSTAGVRQIGFVALGAGAALAQNIALETPKFVRSLVVIDSTLRPHPTRWERAVDRLEERLPFGLPLRLGSNGFNVQSYAHRLRCPLLIVQTHRANAFVRSELQALSRIAPTAWHVALSAHDQLSEGSELGQLVLEFQETPAKCPQKNLQEVS